MRILITGSRRWTDRDTIARSIVEVQAELAPLQPGQVDYNDGDWTIVHGGAPGADALAGEWASAAGYREEVHPAPWNLYGAAAGPRRNARMVARGADICLAFPMVGSRGTWNCVELARLAGIEVRIIKPGFPGVKVVPRD
jgi:SLOG family YspA-like protein